MDYVILAAVIYLVIRAVRNDKADGRKLGGGGKLREGEPPIDLQ